ncbi:MAG: hypothetical protein M1838_006197, partial [Thelocarpon superellum]
MAVQTYHLEHLPVDRPVHIALFRNVRNAGFLKEQLLSGNIDFEYALIDASMIVSTIHALAAVFRAVNDMMFSRLRSRNVHSEVVFALSPNNNISEALSRFGIGEHTTSLLVVKVSTVPEVSSRSVQQHLDKVLEGTPVDFSDENLHSMTDLARVRKVYKLQEGARKVQGRSSKKGSLASGLDETKVLDGKELE